ncbi:MAG: cation diffusion facilitator family transporter [Eubacteriales bacterium]|nr:cation diffusion facilitator family transporter [Eubacteriales bacterium]
MDAMLKLFIKDYQNVKDPAVRQRYGNFGSTVGIVTNVLLCAGKLAVGLLFHSVSVTADAVNNLSDAGSSVISLVSFKMANRPADAKHPFGHARIEYIAALIVAFLIVILGIELIKSSITKIITPDEIAFSVMTVVVLVLSIAAKLGLYLMNKKLGKRIDSSVMQATATDSLSDVLATSGVLLSTLLSPVFHFSLDGYMGAVVAVFIIISGFRIAVDTMDHLVGQAPSEELIHDISAYVLKYEGVIGIHDLMIHNYGPNRCFASVHAEVEADRDIMVSHDIMDNIERDIAADLGIHLVIHLDPVDTENEEVNALRRQVAALVRGIDGALSMHDFRTVSGLTHRNLIFDVQVPYTCAKSDQQILEELHRGIKAMSADYFAVVTLDRTYAALPQGRVNKS